MGDSQSPDWEQLFADPLHNGRPWQGEVSGRARDGAERWLQMTVAPCHDDEGKLSEFLVFIQDCTEFRQLQSLVIDMERLSTRGAMAREIAHEINNYLTILGGNLDVLPMLLAAGQTQKVEKKFAAMRQALDKIARFADGLMGHRDAESEPSPCDLHRLIEGLIGFLKPQNRYDNIDINLHSGPGVPELYVNVGQIQQVMVNLLNNAADAVQESRSTPGRIDIETHWLQDQDAVAVSVSDNGGGIGPALCARLFRERYSSKKGGHGLGLLNCHKIVEAHGGQIRVESVEGKGTTFTLTLPGRDRTAGRSGAQMRARVE
jgi:signal transduction histidine kinase